MSRPALFLDRDGVINVDHGYVYRQDDFEFVDGIFELVAQAHRLGYLVIIVTNQAGIGRGYYGEADFYALMGWVRDQFVQQGGKIDAVYFCPEHPEYGIEKYRRDTEFRKPGPGMFLQAKREWNIDMKCSIMVGDKPSDMEAAYAAGVGTLFFLTEDTPAICNAIAISHLSTVLPFLKPVYSTITGGDFGR